MRTRSLKVPVPGLACGGGGGVTVEKAVRGLAGVVAVHVNPATEAAYVDYDPALCKSDDLSNAIESAGYGVVRPRDPGAVA